MNLRPHGHHYEGATAGIITLNTVAQEMFVVSLGPFFDSSLTLVVLT